MTIKVSQPLFARFHGPAGENRVREAVKDQQIVLGNHDAAEQLATRGTLRNFEAGDLLMEQGEASNSIFLILAGSVEILINNGGFKIHRTAKQHVGEMAMIDPSESRSASVRASEPTVALEVQEADFSDIAHQVPSMWRQLAKELGARLRQRSSMIRPRNALPRVFVASASESLPVAKAFEASLSPVGDIQVWADDKVFKPSTNTMNSLRDMLDQMDFVVAIFSPDDRLWSRRKLLNSPRDNTVFELGLFAGKMGIERAFYAVPSGKKKVKVPTDLAGITHLSYENGVPPGVDKASATIRERIRELEPR
ncbi:cyclic nucleotide-binding domain-containing protein [Rhizobium leguminosarum]|uniref:TIR domain-containing protein n=1 Tax=Rhizobium leguminosarum TaxID=384 RepID=UPI00102F6ED2|nr:TIR domain-containing protein [Rhizobium leguminosarum]TAZ15422.1 cyclic nucleotide-binding domain-containing protein [Rhizobium leguminosarum]